MFVCCGSELTINKTSDSIRDEEDGGEAATETTETLAKEIY